MYIGWCRGEGGEGGKGLHAAFGIILPKSPNVQCVDNEVINSNRVANKIYYTIMHT